MISQVHLALLKTETLFPWLLWQTLNALFLAMASHLSLKAVSLSSFKYWYSSLLCLVSPACITAPLHPFLPESSSIAIHVLQASYSVYQSQTYLLNFRLTYPEWKHILVKVLRKGTIYSPSAKFVIPTKLFC